MKMIQKTMEFYVTLDAEELADRKDRFIAQDKLVGEMEDREKARAKAAKQEISAAEAEKDRLRRIIDSGEESRPVTCEDRADWTRGIIETFRLDTGSVVGSRVMTEVERQQSLDLAEARSKQGLEVVEDEDPEVDVQGEPAADNVDGADSEDGVADPADAFAEAVVGAGGLPNLDEDPKWKAPPARRAK